MLRIQLGFWILRMSRIFSDHYQNILVKALSEKAKNIKTWFFLYKMLQYEHCIINCLINILAFLNKNPNTSQQHKYDGDCAHYE